MIFKFLAICREDCHPSHGYCENANECIVSEIQQGLQTLKIYIKKIFILNLLFLKNFKKQLFKENILP